MTIIAWDGKSLAVDRMAHNHGLATVVKKYREMPNGDVAVCCGDNEQGIVLFNWYEDGCDTKKWPKFQRTDDWSRLVVAGDFGIICYEQEPVRQMMEDKCQAWGSGRDYALGAMYMGASAEKAIEVASAFNVYCGHGVDVFHFGENK